MNLPEDGTDATGASTTVDTGATGTGTADSSTSTSSPNTGEAGAITGFTPGTSASTGDGTGTAAGTASDLTPAIGTPANPAPCAQLDTNHEKAGQVGNDASAQLARVRHTPANDPWMVLEVRKFALERAIERNGDTDQILAAASAFTDFLLNGPASTPAPETEAA
ncbi:hypothetical protein [Novosphingobium rosa]|uniref:hypothetical protein n=1 Tax=Novosphingobium rosa TaxID=76978 RepID=UPI0008305909|nr:hypothetical protein [Novosphingobium rosa]